MYFQYKMEYLNNITDIEEKSAKFGMYLFRGYKKKKISINLNETLQLLALF